MVNMSDEVLDGLGVDLNSNFGFHDGDVVLSKYEDNLVQAVVNRLRTDWDELDLFYEGYGSVLSNFFGWKGVQSTLDFVKAEVVNVLSMEDRLSGEDVTVSYAGDGAMRIDLVLYVGTDEYVDMSLSLNENGVELIEEE